MARPMPKTSCCAAAVEVSMALVFWQMRFRFGRVTHRNDGLAAIVECQQVSDNKPQGVHPQKRNSRSRDSSPRARVLTENSMKSDR